ncbi:MAG: hypothetical protein E7375_04005 [Clostridiales bacterium]|nr:hypothetical protein [Clostridiales bacterium]
MKKYLVAILMILCGLGCTITATVFLVDNYSMTEEEGGFSEEIESGEGEVPEGPEIEDNPQIIVEPDLEPGKRIFPTRSFEEVKAELGESSTDAPDSDLEGEEVEGKATYKIAFSGVYSNSVLRIYVNGTLTHELPAFDSNPDYSNSSSNYTSFTFSTGDVLWITDCFVGNYWFTSDVYSAYSGGIDNYKEIYVTVGTSSVRSSWLIMLGNLAEKVTISYDAFNGSFTAEQDSSQNCTTFSRTLATLGGRNFYTPSYSGTAYKYMGYHTTGEAWSGALVVSTDSSAVVYYTAYNTSNRYGYDGSISYGGSTYYYGGVAEKMQSQIDSYAEQTHIGATDIASAASTLLSTARRYVYSENSVSGYYDFPLYSPTRDGYSFAGWYTASSGGTKVTTSTTVSTISSNNHTLYAQWTARSYTVTYQPNGGSGSSVSQTVTYKSSFTTNSSSTFTRTGYTLSAWSTSSTSQAGSYRYCNYSYTYNTVGNTTLYARWTPNWYTVYLYDENWDYSTNATLYGYAVSHIEIQYGDYWENGYAYNEDGMSGYFSEVEVSATGKTFVGWYEDNYLCEFVDIENDTFTIGYDTYLIECWVPNTTSVSLNIYQTSDGSTWSASTQNVQLKLTGFLYPTYTSYGYGVNTSGYSNTATYKGTSNSLGTNFAQGYTINATILSVPSGYIIKGYNTGNGATTPTQTGKITTASWSAPYSSTTYINLYLVQLQNPLKWGEDNVTYSTEAVSGVTYGFTLNSAGYYESTNQGVNSSYSLTKFNFTKKVGQTTLTMNCINYGESCCDYGILSNIDTTLALSNTADTTNVKKKFSSSESKATVQTVTYDISSLANNSSHYIYVKFRKDGSVNSGNDSLQFRPDFGTGYWYFEDGQYPQSYVGSSMNTTLNGLTTSQLGSVVYTIKYNDGSTNKTLNAYTYSGTTYVQVTAPKTVTIDGVTFSSGSKYWFKSEPIRWRVSDIGTSPGSIPSNWANYGQIVTGFTVVSHKILGAGAVLSGKMSDGYAYTSSSMYSNVNSLTATVYGSYAQQVTFGCETFKAGTGQVGVTSGTTNSYVGIAQETNLSSFYTDYKATYTTFSALLLGKASTIESGEYFLRNLGSNLNSMRGINSSGKTCNLWANKMNGYRLAVNMSKGMRV